MHRRHPRALLALLLGLAVLGLPVLTAGSASADTPCTPGPTCLATRVLVLTAPARAVYKHTMTITGELDAQDPSDETNYGWVPGQTLTLQRKTGQGDWTSIGDAVTSDVDGSATFSTPAVKNAQYQLVYAGGTYTSTDGTSSIDLAPSTSTTRGIHVYRDLHDRGVKQSGKNYLVGNVDPGWGGKTIYLQRKTCSTCAWKGYATQRTTSTGGWKFRVPSPKHGKWWWRSYVPATTDYLKSMSGVYYTYTTYF